MKEDAVKGSRDMTARAWPGDVEPTGDERGATAVEYALMLVAVTLVIPFTVGLMGVEVRGLFERFNTDFAAMVP